VPAEVNHHVTGPLTVAVGLALTAGFVDAFIYHFVTPVFVANMSGNMVRVGMAIGGGDWHSVGASMIAIASFVTAAVIASMTVDLRVRSRGRAGPADPAPLLLVEILLLFAVATVAVSAKVTFSPRLVWANVTIIALGSAAMGVQAIALRRVGQIAVSTTYGTGALVRIGEKVGLGLRGAPRWHDVPRRRSVGVLVTVLAAYVAGAASAVALPLHRSFLGVVPFLLLGLAHLAHRLHEPEVVEAAGRQDVGPRETGGAPQPGR
jgi:uncharacterized membrane protein YoaK (UPF0700 family)